jgi:hypothetical protein
MFKVSPATLQTFIDTSNCVLEHRVQYSTVHIPNVLWFQEVETDKTVPNNNPRVVKSDNEKGTCLLIDITN